MISWNVEIKIHESAKCNFVSVIMDNFHSMAIPMATVLRETSINESVVLAIKQFICKSKVIYIFLVFARSKWKKKNY